MADKVPLFKQSLSPWQKVSQIIQQISTRYTDSQAARESKVMTYYMVLSIFPLLIFIGNVLPFLRLNPDLIMEYMQPAVPTQVTKLVFPIVNQLLNKESGGLLSFGAIATLWAGSKGLNSMRLGVNAAYNFDPSTVYSKAAWKNAVVNRLLSFTITLSFLSFMLVFVVFFAFGQLVVEGLTPLLGWSTDLLTTFTRWRWPTALLFLFVAVLILQRMLPNVRIRLSSLLPGTLFITAAWLIVTQLFSLYVRYFAKSYSTYGTIGTFMVALLWLNLLATLFLLGTVINAIFDEARFGLEHEVKGRTRRYLKNKVKHLMN